MGVKDNVSLFSWVYNGAYCIPNIIICTVLMVIFAKAYPVFFEANENGASTSSVDSAEEEAE